MGINKHDPGGLMIDFLASVFAVFGVFFWLVIAMFFISHMLDWKADRDHKKKIETAKKRAWKDHCNWWIK